MSADRTGATAFASALAATLALHHGHLAALGEGSLAGAAETLAFHEAGSGSNLRVAILAQLALFAILRPLFGLVLRLKPLQKTAAGPGIPVAALVLAVTGVVALAAVRSLPQASASQKLASLSRQPNIVFILADTLRRDRLGLYGYDKHPTSPRIDAFAARSTVFDDAVANSSWTIPSTASLWTGRWLMEHGSSTEARLLHSSFATLPGILKDHGYRTMAVSSNSMINGLQQGYVTPFDWVQDTSTDAVRDSRTRRAVRGVFPLEEAFDSLTGVAQGAPFFTPVLPENPGDLGVHETTEAALQYVDMAREDDRPFFLFAGYMANHRPYQFPADFNPGFQTVEKPAGREWDPIIRASSVPAFPSIHLVYWRQLLAATGTHPYTPEDLQYLSDLYDKTVRYLDDECGRLLAGLEERGLLENTLVVFTSDHGESLGESTDFGHGRLLSSPLIDLPLFIYDPAEEPRRVTHPVQSIDLLPTLLGRLGIDARSATGGALPGSDLFGPRSHTPIVAELHYNTGAPGWEHSEPLERQMRQIMQPGTVQREVNLMRATELHLPDTDAAPPPSLKNLLGHWIRRVESHPTLVPGIAGRTDQDPAIDRGLGPGAPRISERVFRDYYFAARRALITDKWSYERTSTGEEVLINRETGKPVVAPSESLLAPLRKQLERWRKSVRPFDQAMDLKHASQIPYFK